MSKNNNNAGGHEVQLQNLEDEPTIIGVIPYDRVSEGGHDVKPIEVILSLIILMLTSLVFVLI